MANLIEKAPLGAVPFSIQVDGRIKDLAGAIDRYADYSSGAKYLSMRRWAKEIILQCDLAEKMMTDPAARLITEVK